MMLLLLWPGTGEEAGSSGTTELNSLTHIFSHYMTGYIYAMNFCSVHLVCFPFLLLAALESLCQHLLRGRIRSKEECFELGMECVEISVGRQDFILPA